MMSQRRRLSYTSADEAVHESIRAEMDRILERRCGDPRVTTMMLASAMARGAKRLSRNDVPTPPPQPPCREGRFEPPWVLLWRFLFPWRTVRDNGKTVYQEGRLDPNKRRAWQRPGGYQPIDQHWISTGKWSTHGVEPTSPWPRR